MVQSHNLASTQESACRRKDGGSGQALQREGKQEGFCIQTISGAFPTPGVPVAFREMDDAGAQAGVAGVRHSLADSHQRSQEEAERPGQSSPAELGIFYFHWNTSSPSCLPSSTTAASPGLPGITSKRLKA